jgi:hypothetical protein
LVFKKNANFFTENWEKSQKIVIITSTPGANPMITSYNACVAKFTVQLIVWRVFRLKIILLGCKNVLAYNNAGVVGVNSEVAGFPPVKITYVDSTSYDQNKMARSGLRLYTAGSGFCEPGCLCSKIGLGVCLQT